MRFGYSAIFPTLNSPTSLVGESHDDSRSSTAPKSCLLSIDLLLQYLTADVDYIKKSSLMGLKTSINIPASRQIAP